MMLIQIHPRSASARYRRILDLLQQAQAHGCTLEDMLACNLYAQATPDSARRMLQRDVQQINHIVFPLGYEIVQQRRPERRWWLRTIAAAWADADRILAEQGMDDYARALNHEDNAE